MVMCRRLSGFARVSVAAVAALVLLTAPMRPVLADDVVATDQPVVVVQLAQATPDANDPIEPVNRAIFAFNEFIYALLIRPMAEFYVLVLPQEARDGVKNFLTNVRTPVVLANDLLQGEGQRAWITTERFVINSTVGIGGLIDVAKMWGIEGHDEDVGQTFAVWGAPEGFYLVLPVLGPSNPRDAIGQFLDGYLDPVSYWASNTDREEITWGRTLLRGVDSYSRVMDDLKKLKDTSIDYYAAVRSISRQKREAEIRNGAPQDTPLPDIKYDFNAELTTR
jgi:phospholipid-binding lipoprotein MlaA